MENKHKDFCKNILADYPDYKVFWRSGYAYRGAVEVEENRDANTFENRMEEHYNRSAVINVMIDTDKKELHFNGFSE